MSKKETNITIYSYEEGMRLGRFLLRITEKVPKSMIYKLIRKKDIRINNKKTDFDYRLETGDIISIRFFNILIEKNNAPNNKKIKEYIIYEDENMIVINKPAGISIHSGERAHIDILEYMPYFGNFKPSPINRIDKDTSGIVLFGKSYRFTKAAKENWKYCKKTYIAEIFDKNNVVVEGKTVILRNSLKKIQINGFERMRSHKDGKQALLSFRVIGKKNNLKKVLIHLHTGLNHQIRAQFCELGAPLSGDKKYGYNGAQKSLQLQSYRLILNIPGYKSRMFKLGKRIINVGC